MLSTIYLLKYNNYYNRIVKKESTLAAYATHLIEQTARANINFNPNDGVDTELVIGSWSSDIPDYMLVVENNTIVSRWFVIEAARTRAEQFKLTLKRDVIVDNYDAVINSTCFIDKAKVPINDIAIYNKEPYAFNSIKQSETLLKDETNCAWIVGYISSKDLEDDGQTEVKLHGDIDYYGDDSQVDYQISDINNFWSTHFTGYTYNTLTDTDALFKGPDTFEVGMNNWNSQGGNGIIHRVYARVNEEGITGGVKYIYNVSSGNYNTYSTNTFSNTLRWDDEATVLIRDSYNDLFTHLKTSGYNSSAKCSSLEDEDGKIIKDTGSGKYYSISVNKTTVDKDYSDGFERVTSDNYANVKADLQDVITAVNTSGSTGGVTVSQYTGSSTPENFYFFRKREITYEVLLIELGNNTAFTYVIPSASNRNHLIDAPYDMFCIPYSDSIKIYQNGTLKLTNRKSLMFAAAMQMAKDYSGVGFLYDIQLLPYCPLPSNLITNDGNIDFKNNAVGRVVTEYNTQNESTKGYIFFANQSQFEFSIASNIAISDIKQQHQTDNWRFNSPNWSGSYDFDVTLNQGLSQVDIDCTYKPYTPYIHVCPRFNANGYYGFNPNDAVGLICGGDFSLPVVTDQWKTYEYSNKNYQNIFNRQIQNQTTNYRLQQIEQGANAISGILTGGVTGAAMTGNVAGGIVGAGLSAVGAVADAQILKKQYQESKSYATDVFNYQIDNIKSLPNTLTKVSAFNANNKIFPFIEYFSCSDQEKTIFNNLIQWQGMTVNRIDKISTFLTNDKNFVKCRLIRIDDSIAEDFHLVAAIAKELSEGVFI